MFREKSLLASRTLTIKSGDLAGQEITIEDWWQNVHGGESWMARVPSNSNLGSSFPPAVIQYAARVPIDNLPVDDDVLYGKIKNVGFLVHISELEGEAQEYQLGGDQKRAIGDVTTFEDIRQMEAEIGNPQRQ